ncbi:hypothetical protein [Psychrobacter sp. BI730]|uniref:hypothetical protein n=1 Tax=Psychrobacter sp. BI730 TaxID=2705463 RepID=UPI0015C9E52F|nr:hypothetical protein [Psychrobacter sp. BI730]NYR08368.1 hypothetical protein [Psychrobacter sp. BI730]
MTKETQRFESLLGLVPRYQPTQKHGKRISNYAQTEESLRTNKDAQARLFSRDYSGILLTTMAMQSVTECSIETTGMRSDTIDCTPAAKQIQAVGGIGYCYH